MTLKTAPHLTIAKKSPHSTLRSTQDLLDVKLIAKKDVSGLEQLTDHYQIAVTPEMVSLITSANDDPIARQFVPSVEELKVLPQERVDPIGDYPHAPLKALVHRHENRVLLKPTNVCAVYCRFCFRREMIGPDGDTITHSDVDQALAYIEANAEISEVILTGGDPLMLSSDRLSVLMQRLQAIPHLRWIRIHTRIPVVSPKKITQDLIDALRGIKPVMMAIHANHAREITQEAGSALARLAHSGIVLLGQSVLLKGVNNSVEALTALFETMMVNRVKPYYLHHPDLTTGTSHFRLSFEDGMALMKQVRSRASGICIPDYVIDIPGGYSKIPVTPEHVEAIPGQKGAYLLKDMLGNIHKYRDMLA